MERFYIGGANLPKVQPQYCGHLNCEPGRRVERTHLERYLLHYVFSGSGTFHKYGKKYAIKAGDLFICCPGENAHYIADSTTPWHYTWVSFNCAQELDLLFRQDVISLPNAKRLFMQMISAREDPVREWVVCGLLYQLFALLSSRLDNPTHQRDYLREALTYIEENYSQHLQVDAIAKAIGMSRSHFSRLFKRQTGLSPQDYIVSYRLEKGAELLTDPQLTQKEIARHLGYPDVSTFSRMFKRKYGVSPGKFRQNSHLPLSE